MKSLYSLLLIACALSFPAIADAFAWQNNENVAYESEIIDRTDTNSAYLKFDIWYPTEKEPLWRSIQREDKLYYLATRAEPVNRELDLLIISTPSFAEGLDYSELSYALADAGFLVVALTHTGDNKSQMLYTMQPEQQYIRAVQIHQVVTHFSNSEKFVINKENISVLSFTETALAPLLLRNVKLDTEQYSTYCLQNLATTSSDIDSINNVGSVEDSDSFCSPLYAKQVSSILEGIKKLPVNYVQMNSSKNDNVPQIKNYFMIEPVFTFLFKRDDSNTDYNYNIFPLYTEEHYFSSTDMQFDYLSILAKGIEKYEIEAKDQASILDICSPSELPTLDEICVDITENDHASYIESVVGKMTELLEQNL